MTAITAPPVDHAPRIASVDASAFPVPTGREEEWRFAPMQEIAAFMEPMADAGCLTATEGAHVRMLPVADLAPSGWLPTDRPSAIAFGQVRSAVSIRVADDETVAAPIVVPLHGDEASCYGHIDVRVGRHARATIVLVHDLGVHASGSIVVDVADGAELTVLSILDGPAETTQLWNWHTRVGRDASVVASAVTMGGRVVRITPSVAYAGPGGSAEFLGAFLADSGQYFEHRIFVDHGQPHCSSSVVYKGALSGPSTHTVWIGDVLVRRDAVGTDTYEMNRNLLLDDGPRADSVPNLELETGDVASAGHASATGRFDDQQLFYLQARGIPERVARQLVVRGFFVDVLARIPSREVRESVLRRIAQRLGMDPDLESDLEADLQGLGSESAT